MTVGPPERPRHTQAECARLLDRLLVEPDELLAAPGPELRGRPTNPVEPGREIVELLGRALWDVFSNNHAVVDGDGTAYDLGSFRASAGFIAEAINRGYTALPVRCGYLDFYLGTLLVSHRADLGPVYRWIFSRLQAERCRWLYSLPRFHLVDPGEPGQGATEYDPREGVRRDLERDARAREARELRKRLERSHRERLERARHGPLPETVAAYRDIFGALPAGWPHPPM